MSENNNNNNSDVSSSCRECPVIHKEIETMKTTLGEIREDQELIWKVANAKVSITHALTSVGILVSVMIVLVVNYNGGIGKIEDRLDILQADLVRVTTIVEQQGHTREMTNMILRQIEALHKQNQKDRTLSRR
jgi:hypothetical protein